MHNLLSLIIEGWELSMKWQLLFSSSFTTTSIAVSLWSLTLRPGFNCATQKWILRITVIQKILRVFANSRIQCSSPFTSPFHRETCHIKSKSTSKWLCWFVQSSVTSRGLQEETGYPKLYTIRKYFKNIWRIRVSFHLQDTSLGQLKENSNENKLNIGHGTVDRTCINPINHHSNSSPWAWALWWLFQGENPQVDNQPGAPSAQHCQRQEICTP